jgi:hypothetical protein
LGRDGSNPGIGYGKVIAIGILTSDATKDCQRLDDNIVDMEELTYLSEPALRFRRDISSAHLYPKHTSELGQSITNILRSRHSSSRLQRPGKRLSP